MKTPVGFPSCTIPSSVPFLSFLTSPNMLSKTALITSYTSFSVACSFLHHLELLMLVSVVKISNMKACVSSSSLDWWAAFETLIPLPKSSKHKTPLPLKNLFISLLFTCTSSIFSAKSSFSGAESVLDFQLCLCLLTLRIVPGCRYQQIRLWMPSFSSCFLCLPSLFIPTWWYWSFTVCSTEAPGPNCSLLTVCPKVMSWQLCLSPAVTPAALFIQNAAGKDPLGFIIFTVFPHFLILWCYISSFAEPKTIFFSALEGLCSIIFLHTGLSYCHVRRLTSTFLLSPLADSFWSLWEAKVTSFWEHWKAYRKNCATFWWKILSFGNTCFLLSFIQTWK